MEKLALPGVKHSLDGDTLTVSGKEVPVDDIKKAIKSLGFGIKVDEA